MGNFYTLTLWVAYSICCVVQTPGKRWEQILRCKRKGGNPLLSADVYAGGCGTSSCVGGGFLGAKMCSRNIFHCWLSWFVLTQPSFSPQCSGRESRSVVVSCVSWLVDNDGQKGGRSSVTFCSLPWSTVRKPWMIASLSCCSGQGLNSHSWWLDVYYFLVAKNNNSNKGKKSSLTIVVVKITAE